MNLLTTALNAIIRSELVKTVAKRQMNLANSLTMVYAAVYGQCSQEVKDKLKASEDWERIQRNQSLHKLINRIEQICIGFDNHI